LYASNLPADACLALLLLFVVVQQVLPADVHRQKYGRHWSAALELPCWHSHKLKQRAVYTTVACGLLPGM
jgi:hypothetical protein